MSEVELLPSKDWIRKIQVKVTFGVAVPIILFNTLLFLGEFTVITALYSVFLAGGAAAIGIRHGVKIVSKWSVIITDSDVLHINWAHKPEIDNVSKRIATNEKFYTFSESTIKISRAMFPSLESQVRSNAR